MIATLKGRLQTKLLTYPLLALVTLVFSLLGGREYWLLFTLAVIVGLVLETIWGLILTHEPGGLTLLFAVLEFGLIALGAILLHIPMSMMAGLWYYLTAWSLIQLCLIYLVTVIIPTWPEDGGELR